MPELAEVSRMVHFLSEYVVGKTLTKVTAINDDLIFGKAGTSASEFQKAIEGKRVVSAGQQGKFFWMIMSEPPHAVLHFGMSGWLKIRGVDTYYYRSDKHEDEEWPPKHWKFLFETDGDPKTEAAFIDIRRLSRVYLVDCPAEDIRKHSPLKDHGPDPIIDKSILTEKWLAEKIKSKRVPVKVFLLDQANISGIGNWMGDEILYHAKIYPEQYSNTLTNEQIKQLYSSIEYVCTTAVHLLADSEKFPKDWLFNYRWGKGKKNHPSVLPNGEKIIYLTVGGRTSAVVPSVQKKTGPVVKDISEEDDKVPDSQAKRKRVVAVKKEEELDDTEEKPKAKKQGLGRQSKPSKDAGESKTDSTKDGRRRSMRLRK